MRANYLLLLAATAVQAAPFIKRYENTTAPASQLSTSLADGSTTILGSSSSSVEEDETITSTIVQYVTVTSSDTTYVSATNTLTTTLTTKPTPVITTEAEDDEEDNETITSTILQYVTVTSSDTTYVSATNTLTTTLTTKAAEATESKKKKTKLSLPPFFNTSPSLLLTPPTFLLPTL